jgi:hypothetical protein
MSEATETRAERGAALLEGIKRKAKAKRRKRRARKVRAATVPAVKRRAKVPETISVRLPRPALDTIMQALQAKAFAAGDGRSVRREREALRALMSAVLQA